MRLRKKISEVTEMFYKDEKDNVVLTIFWNSLYVAFFLLPLGINLSTPFFIISIFLGIINSFRSSKKNIFDNKIVLLFPLYFVLMTISLLYTDNISYGLTLLQRSLALLLFPLIFLFVKEDASTVKKLFNFLHIGLLVSFIINFSIAIYSSMSTIKDFISFNVSIEEAYSFIDSLRYGWNYFIGAEFSKLINPSYTSLYILLVLSYYLKNKLESRQQVFTVFIMFLYLFLLASRVAYFILMIISVLLIFNIKDKSKKYTMSLLFFLGLIVFLNNPRVFDFYSTIKESNKTFGYENITAQQSRILIWDASFQLIKEAPLLGYGIGDAEDALIEKYKELNYIQNYINQYNAHNQFLQTFLQIGVVGFGVLSSIFIILAINMRRSRNEFSVFLILLISLFFESMLVRFNGIVFFSIIIPLLLKKRSILSSRIIRNQPILDLKED